jgi:phosphatidate cytidylyltransferase
MILKGGVPLFSFFIILVSFVGLHEFYRMMLPDHGTAGIAFSVVGALLPLFVHVNHPMALLGGLTTVFLLVSLHFLFHHGDIAKVAPFWGVAAAGILYVPLLLAHLLLLRMFQHGISWIFLLLFIVMFSDTFAYYIGSRFGRNRLYPSVSPNKSVEGAAGGLLGAVSGTLVAHFSFFPQLAVGDCLVLAVSAGIMAQLGDLFESLLKRSAGVKDSGVIIPGHGGILDRLDSIIFAAPVVYYYAVFVWYGRTGF